MNNLNENIQEVDVLRQEDQIPNVNLALNVVINEIQCIPQWISHMQMWNTSWLSYMTQCKSRMLNQSDLKNNDL